MNFKEMHHQDTPLLICNVWDAASARTAELAGYQAVATSSYAVAAMLGYKDGEQLPFAELLYLVERIASSCALPLSVDIEAGYSRDVNGIVANIAALAKLGVVGVNIEDSLANGARGLVDPITFAETISDVKGQLTASDIDVFLNIRTDGFLLGLENAREETIRRGRIYAEAGADGLFAPCITQEADIAAVVAAVPLPLNVLAVSSLPNFATLQALGVKRISMGNALFDRLQDHLMKRLIAARSLQTIAPIFDDAGY